MTPSSDQTRQRALVLAAAVLYLLAVTALDRLTGRFIGLSLFYIPGIAWAAWRVGPRVGWAMAVASAAAWFVADPYDLPLTRIWNATLRFGFFGLVVYLLLRLKRELQRRNEVIGELEDALEQVETLRGLLPVCAWCKRVRDDEGYWKSLETYVRQNAGVEVTHGICPSCHQDLDDEIGEG
ncbi:MAG: hypothetical protein ACQEXJ_19645 [Myxococcota bacterium]